MSDSAEQPAKQPANLEELAKLKQLEQKKLDEAALLGEDFGASVSKEEPISESIYPDAALPHSPHVSQIKRTEPHSPLHIPNNIPNDIPDNIPDNLFGIPTSPSAQTTDQPPLKDSVIRPGLPPLERPSSRTSSVSFSPEDESLKPIETPMETPVETPMETPGEAFETGIPSAPTLNPAIPPDLPQGLPQNAPLEPFPSIPLERVSKIGPSASDRIRPTRASEPVLQTPLEGHSEAQSKHTEGRRGWGKFVGFLILGLLLGGGVGVWSYWKAGQASTHAPIQEFEVKRGMTLPEVIAELERRKLIKNATIARVVLRQRETGAKLHQGFFTLGGNMNLADIAETLEGVPHFPVVEVLIPEGKRLAEIVELVATAPLSNRADLRRAFSNAALSKYAKGTLEGFLFPAKYPFDPKTTAETIAKTLVERGNLEFSGSNLAKAKKLGLSPFGWAILASMVQAEAGSAAEMPAIAGVFLNRLNIGMRLQSDPTVAYGLNIALPKLNRGRGDFERATPYNTYTTAALPKGPINNPGKAALEAVINPVLKVNGKPAIYFLHGKNQKLYLNSNFNDHMRDNTLHR
jgi:UPF0755 protein